MGAVKHSTFRRNQELVNRFGYDPYYAGTIVGYDSSEFERLVSHFGQEEAMRMLEEYGDEAFNFLPNKEFGKQNFYLSGPQTSKLTPQNISAYCDMVENGVDWNLFKAIGNVAKGAFKVVTWVPRTIVKGAIAGGKVVVKGTGKIIKVAGQVITKAPYILAAPILVPLAVGAILAHKKRTGKKLISKTEAMKAIANDSTFQAAATKQSVKSFVDASDLADHDVGFPLMIIVSIISFLWPLIANLLAKKEANPTTDPATLYNQAQQDPEFQATLANLEAQQNEPLEEVKGNWFAKNWWIVASAGGAVLLITTIVLLTKQPRRAVASDVGKLIKGSKEAKQYMARLRALRDIKRHEKKRGFEIRSRSMPMRRRR